METLTERIKEAIVAIIAVLISIITPLANAIFVLMIFFTFNIIMGFQADKAENGADFSLKKSFDAIKLLIFYYGALFVMHATLAIYGELNIAELLSKWVTLIVCYFLLLNILRNACKVFPKNQSLRFFYSFLRIEVYSYLRRKIGLILTDGDEEKGQ